MNRQAMIVAAAGSLVAYAATAGTVVAPQVARVASDQVVVSWSGEGPVDVYVADRPDATIAEATLVSDDDADGRHHMTLDPAHRRYFFLRSEDGSTAATAERALPLERGSNFRDLGGYPAADGKHVRWGMIYRSAATPLLSDQDVDSIAELGIKAMIDLRSVEERELAPTRLGKSGARYIAHDYPASTIFDRLQKLGAEGASRSLYRDWPTALAPQYRAIFAELLGGNGAVSYNCSAGQDRTGLATALVLSALGVPRDIILQDYHLSTVYRHPEHEMPAVNFAAYPRNPVAVYFARAGGQPGSHKPRPLYRPDGRAQLMDSFEEIESRWGSVDTYLERVLRVGVAERARLRSLYLD